MYSDQQLEAYLDAVSEYEALKREAGHAWQEAYLQLAKARLSQSVSYLDHDPLGAPATTVKNGRVVLRTSTAMTGAWPPRALRDSQSEFVRALEREVQCWALKQKINNIL